ncbi:exonuclease 1 [Gadus chalcogrammus]|uniref:exonuclease 1 n=1 Tax=Gadus chalcogrammus TaxID=1042646 RepID=UPI0024C4E2EE|nr:exonuclease 1 [Gadus chalcogrammus]
MGIQGLLQFLKDASEPVHVKKYRGQTVAVDTYCWLHKGAFSCAEKLAKGEPTDQYVTYCMKFVDMLLSFGVRPILVFDGCNLPSKREVEKSRRERRQANLQKGKQLLREGKLSEARDCFTKSVNVTPSMAHDVIKAARARGVDCVVAPYEADAQLAFLSKVGLAQAIITEDSDLLAFGCKKVLLKMDKEGNGLEIDQAHLGRCRSLGGVFTEEKFRYMCILSGCDYLASLYGIGLGKACKLLKMANNPDILAVIRKMGQYLKMSVAVPEEYLQGFTKADNTFLYQLVFDPLQRKVVPLNPYPEHLDPSTLSYAGLNKGDEKGYQMALGNLDIHTMEKIDNFNPDKVTLPTVKPRSRCWKDTVAPPRRGGTSASIWSRGYSAGCTANNASLVKKEEEEEERPTPPSTRGQERVVGLQGLRLPSKQPGVKRPREDSSLSDQDVLQLYTGSSGLKRARSEEQEQEEKPSLPRPPGGSSSGAPRPRNRFATLLQRRNQGEEADGQATRSRFFSASCEAPALSTRDGVNDDAASPSGAREENALSRAEEDGESDGPEAPSIETPSPTSSPSPTATSSTPTATSSSPITATSPRPASQRLGVFRWSGLSQHPPTSTTAAAAAHSTSSSIKPSAAPGPVVSGIAALQRYQRQTESVSWGSRPPAAESPVPQGVDLVDDSPPASPPSQDSAYCSQSPPCDLTSCEAEGVADATGSAASCLLSPCHKDDVEAGLKGSDRGPPRVPKDPKRPLVVRSLVAGLARSRPSNQGAEPPAKLRPVAPARASGLRRRPSGSQGPLGKKPLTNNENNCPGTQATISSLWKNFGFKREHQKLSPSPRGPPMSPVKDNLPGAAGL